MRRGKRPTPWRSVGAGHGGGGARDLATAVSARTAGRRDGPAAGARPAADSGAPRRRRRAVRVVARHAPRTPPRGGARRARPCRLAPANAVAGARGGPRSAAVGPPCVCLDAAVGGVGSPGHHHGALRAADCPECGPRVVAPVVAHNGRNRWIGTGANNKNGGKGNTPKEVGQRRVG